MWEMIILSIFQGFAPVWIKNVASRLVNRNKPNKNLYRLLYFKLWKISEVIISYLFQNYGLKSNVVPLTIYYFSTFNYQNDQINGEYYNTLTVMRASSFFLGGRAFVFVYNAIIMYLLLR